MTCFKLPQTPLLPKRGMEISGLFKTFLLFSKGEDKEGFVKKTLVNLFHQKNKLNISAYIFTL
jgi:hypothetical protein